jgi:hypothetical protein
MTIRSIQPALEKAVRGLDGFRASDLTDASKRSKAPPDIQRVVLDCVLILLGRPLMRGPPVAEEASRLSSNPARLMLFVST